MQVAFDCTVCMTSSHVMRDTIRLIPKFGQVRFSTGCGCIHLHSFPDHVIRQLAQLATRGVLSVDDVALPVIDVGTLPRITVAEALEAADNLDDWLALQLAGAQ